MSGQYTSRWWQDNDLDAYIRGLNETLYTEYDEARFKWKMVNNPFNLGFISIAVVEYDGKPVAFNSFLPLRVRQGNESFPIIQGCDGFVDPRHRRMGLFQQTLRFMFNELEGNGPELLMGFNFSGSAGAAQKVGSTLIGDVHALSANAEDLAKTSFRGEDNVQVKRCSLEELYTIYENWAESTKKLHYHRSPKYLQWIYSHPIRRTSFYRIRGNGVEGYAIVSLERDGCSNTLILEDYTPVLHTPNVVSALIKYIIGLGEPINEVYLTEVIDSHMYRVVKSLGFQTDHVYTLIQRRISGLQERNKKLYRGEVELTNLNNWHLVSSDVF